MLNILMHSIIVLGLVIVAHFLLDIAPEFKDEGLVYYILILLLSVLVYLLAIWKAIVLFIGVCFKLIVDALLTTRTFEHENAD